MIKKPKPSWRHREHLFTAENITRLEFACCKDCIYRKQAAHIKVRALPCGPVVFIMKDGKEVKK